MRKRILCVLILVCISLTSCNLVKSQKSIEDIKKSLLSLKVYTCDVELSVTNNLSTSVYKLKHMYKAPDKYRIELLEPNGLKGYYTIYNGETSYIYHPDIDKYLKIESFKKTTDYEVFIGAFIDYFKQLDKVKVVTTLLDNKKYYVLEINNPNENKYFFAKKLWMNAENADPYLLEIYNKEGKCIIKVVYSNFSRKNDLQNSIFDIQ